MSEKYKLIILPEAQQDIRDIVLYIAVSLSAPEAALDLQDTFEKEIKSLSDMPERFNIIEDLPWKDKSVRKVRVKNYYIYYVISEPDTSVKILALIYSGRDQKNRWADRYTTID